MDINKQFFLWFLLAKSAYVRSQENIHCFWKKTKFQAYSLILGSLMDLFCLPKTTIFYKNISPYLHSFNHFLKKLLKKHFWCDDSVCDILLVKRIFFSKCEMVVIRHSYECHLPWFTSQLWLSPRTDVGVLLNGWNLSVHQHNLPHYNTHSLRFPGQNSSSLG